ncbi:hypothetical protein [Methylocella sp.]|uniref:hypothetical protein n=1 Tax=Methylocella sp. TaxID=1978226 RepID=UPI003783D203
MRQDSDNLVRMDDLVGFGDIPEDVNEMLQKGVALYRRDRGAAELAFRQALGLRPEALPTYLCLYKIHTYQGHLDEALAVAQAGLAEAARQAGLDPDWTGWRPGEISPDVDGPGHFALYTLKALAFIHLRRDERDEARRRLDKLDELGAMERVGGTVIAALAAGVS